MKKGQANALQQSLLTDIVMKEAMQAKEAQYYEEQKASAANQDEYGDREVERKDSLDSDDDFNIDEEDPTLRAIRERRMKEMKAVGEQMIENKAKGYGTYSEIVQDEFLPEVTKNERVLCHFYHPDFERCKIYDLHLKTIAQSHLETKFITLNVEKAPFFVEKLGLQVLPTVIYFQDGMARDRIVGFDGVSEKDDFPTLLLTRILVKCGALDAKNKSEAGRTQINMKAGKHDNFSDSDDEDSDD